MSDTQKTAFVAITHGWHARLLLQSGCMHHLKNLGARVVILSPNADEPEFLTEYAGDFILEKIRTQNRPIFKRLNFLRRRLVLRGKKTDTVEAWIRRLRMQSRMRYFSLRFLEYLIQHVPGTATLLINLDLLLFRDRQYKPLFEKYKPDQLVVCSLVHQEAHFLFKRAKMMRVPVTFVVESWDNPTSKMNTYVPPERFLVWNQINKDELVEYHDVPADKIVVTGSPYHDIYADRRASISRESFFKKLALDVSRKLVVIAGTVGNLYPDFDWFLDELVARTRSDSGFPCQFLIRPHPQVVSGYSIGDGIERLEHYTSRYPEVHFDIPRQIPGSLPVYFDKNDIRHLADILQHADVLISFLSTVTIDACACDTPTILVGFDAANVSQVVMTTKERLSFNHHRNVIRTGGTSVAESMDGLIGSLVAYLENPDLHAAGRKQIVREQCSVLDGKAYQRLANAIHGGTSEVGEIQHFQLTGEKATREPSMTTPATVAHVVCAES